jgi:hypothetical protein
MQVIVENAVAYNIELLYVQYFVYKVVLRKFFDSKTEIQAKTYAHTSMPVFSKVTKCDLSPFSIDPFNYYPNREEWVRVKWGIERMDHNSAQSC